MKTPTEIIKGLGRPVAFFPALAHAFGIKEAILLGQLIYWTPKARTEGGWVFKSAEDLEAETGLSYREQRHARASLVKLGLLSQKHARTEHRMYFRVNSEAVDAALEKHLTKRQVLGQGDEQVDAALEGTPLGGGAPDETSGAQGGEAPDETSGEHLTKRHLAPDETSVRSMESETTAVTTEQELLLPPAAPAIVDIVDGKPIEPEELVGKYNVMAGRFNARTPRPRRRLALVETISPARAEALRKYCRAFKDPRWWDTVFAQYFASPFLLLTTKPTPGHESFTPDLDWLLSKGKGGVENFVKVHDGRYAGDVAAPSSPSRQLVRGDRSPEVEDMVRSFLRKSPARIEDVSPDDERDHEELRQVAREQARRIGA